ncbi:antitoxin Xre/MbcA/ParS toxin-binding domain-containing protein, partial [Planctomycetota bacterium]
VFCRLVNVSVRAVVNVEGGKPVKKLVRPYNEVKRLFDALSEVVDSEAIGPWLKTPNEKFDGSRPIDLIERGEIDRLWSMVYRLRSGMPG